MEQYYAILGISKGASEKDIKRAYFRQIRLHSPEKDPEGFRKVRDAYEKLIQTNPEDEEASFPPVADALQKVFYDRIESLRANNRTVAWRDTAEEAHREFPATAYFHYQLVLAQIACGNYRKAITNAQELVKTDPKNKWYLEQLGRANFKNRYNNKALDAYLEAYKAGNRSLQFMKEYAELCKDRDYHDAAVKIVLEVFENTSRKWNRDNVKYAQVLFSLAGISSRYVTAQNREICARVFAVFADFINTYSVLVQNSGSWALTVTNDLLQSLRMSWHIFAGTKAQEEVLGSLTAAFRGIHNLVGEESIQLKALEQEILEIDRRISKTTRELLMALRYKDRTVREEMRDIKLFALEERKQVLSELSIVQKEYPGLYTYVEDFAKLLQDEAKAEREKRALLEDLGRALNSWDDSENEFLKAYPAYREVIFGKQVAAGTETYVREKKKIGRNDPCPCGSGRKFKQCCMGKGIYD